MRKVIAVDFDGTLAYWDGVWKGDPTLFGDPILTMVDRVRQWLKEGHEIWIFTARLDSDRVGPEVLEEVQAAIWRWTLEHIGTGLKSTAMKKVEFCEIYDDRAFRVESNTGEILYGQREDDERGAFVARLGAISAGLSGR